MVLEILPPTISPVDPLVYRDSSNGSREEKVPGRFPHGPAPSEPTESSPARDLVAPQDPGWEWVAAGLSERERSSELFRQAPRWHMNLRQA